MAYVILQLCKLKQNKYIRTLKETSQTVLTKIKTANNMCLEIIMPIRQD